MIDEETIRTINESISKCLLKIPTLRIKTRGVWMTRKETAERLHVSLVTLRSWTKKGILPSYRLGGRVLYRIDDVEKSLTRFPPESNTVVNNSNIT